MKKPAGLTKRRYGRAHAKRNRCEHCGVTFTANRADAKYCSSRCRQAAYRARTSQPEQLVPAICAHCGCGFWQTHSRRKYCSASCRVLHSRHKRIATIDALQQVLHVSAIQAADIVERQGLVRVSRDLERVGFTYNAGSWHAVKVPRLPAARSVRLAPAYQVASW